jgi:hypothetical protein
MTPAEQAEVDAKMIILDALGFYQDGKRGLPFVTHGLFSGRIPFDLSVLELEDFPKVLYDLGKLLGNQGWDKWGNHSDTGTKFDEHGFDMNGTHQNGTKYDRNGYDTQGLNRNGEYQFPEIPF